MQLSNSKKIAGEIDDKAGEGAVDEAFCAVLNEIYGTVDTRSHRESSWPAIRLSDAAERNVSMLSNDEEGSQCSFPTSIESSASAQEAKRLREEIGQIRLAMQAEKERTAAAKDRAAAAEERAREAEAAIVALHAEADGTCVRSDAGGWYPQTLGDIFD